MDVWMSVHLRWLTLDSGTTFDDLYVYG